MKTERRSILGNLFVPVAGVTEPDLTTSQAKALEAAPEKKVGNVVNHQDAPLFSAHIKYVLDEVEKELIAADSSMQKILKVSLVHNLNNYKAMNKAYKGRFGDKIGCLANI